MKSRILTAYPKKNATQIAFFLDSEEKIRREIRHDDAELSRYESYAAQWSHRLRALENMLSEYSLEIALSSLDAVIGPAGAPGRVPGGVYEVDDEIIERLRVPDPYEHPTDLGASLVDALARQRGARAFVAAPISADELNPIAKLSGLPGLEFGRRMHTLNIKDAVHRASSELSISFDKLSVVVAHLGKNFSICAHAGGRVIDLANAGERGPFSPALSGGVPAAALIRMAYSGMWSVDDLTKKIGVMGGIADYIGVDSLTRLSTRIVHGDTHASLIFRAMAYQISQEIASQATALCGKVDAIILTGGCAYDFIFVGVIKERVDWIAPILVYPGEDEHRAMERAACRVLSGQEKALIFREISREKGV